MDTFSICGSDVDDGDTSEELIEVFMIRIVDEGRMFGRGDDDMFGSEGDSFSTTSGDLFRKFINKAKEEVEV